jgi:uncharacterized repeat protein (TIGR01451 family)
MNMKVNGKMKRKILSIYVIIMLVIINGLALFSTYANADESQPQWPTSWILIETDPVENAEKSFRDVQYAYYSEDSDYLYFRLECYGYPNFSAHPDSRYKWFIDTDDPHDMVWSGGNVVGADFLLFVEDTNNNGIGDIYLLNDINGNGEFEEWLPPNNYYGGLITDKTIANYSIVDKNVYLWIKLESISNPDHAYFTWSTDQKNPNIIQAPTLDRSNIFDADLSKADLSIIKTDNKDPVSPGDFLTYTLNITNHGPHIAEDVCVTDDLPSCLIFNSASPSPTDINGSIYRWYLDSLSVGQSEIIIINVTVNSSFVGTISNTAEVISSTRDLKPGNNYYCQETNVILTADLSISKSADKSVVYPGDYLTYTITITNDGPNVATNVVVYDNLPIQVSFNYANPAPSGNSGSLYWWNIGTISVDESKIITVNVTVNTVPAGTISNSAYVTSDTYDPTPENNDDTEQIGVGSSADLNIVKTASTNFVYIGDDITYTLDVTNNGPNDATNVVVYDDLPSEVSFNFAVPAPSGNNGLLYWWDIGTLDVGGSAQILINVTVNSVPAGTISNSAYVTSDTYDPTPGNSGDSEETTIGSSADLSIVKYANVTTIYPGGPIQYTINVTNHGPDNAVNVNVFDMLPEQVIFNSSDPEPTEVIGSLYRWNYPFIVAGQSEIIILNVTVKNNATGTIINTANVTSDIHDPNDEDEDNEGGDETPIVYRSDLGITKTCNKNNVKIGESLTYSIVVTNYGPDSAINVNVTDILPSQVDYISSNPDPDGSNGSTYWWLFPVLNVSESIEITINVLVNSAASGSIINTANVTSDGSDSSPENDQDTEETTVTPPGSGSSGSSGSSGGIPVVEVDQIPTADAGGPYYGFINTEIELDGSNSKDNDEDGESIVRYDWKFFDEDEWHENIGPTPTYIYNNPGIYNVTLRVYDNEGSSSTDITFAIISQPNYPPDAPTIDGETEGYVNVSYTFNISATDLDGDNITYIINWGDGTSNVSEFLPSGAVYQVSHIWTLPGNYTITVSAVDEQDSKTDTTLDITITDPKPDEQKSDNTLWFLLLLIIAIILISALLFLLKRKKKGKEAAAEPPSE